MYLPEGPLTEQTEVPFEKTHFFLAVGWGGGGGGRGWKEEKKRIK